MVRILSLLAAAVLASGTAQAQVQVVQTQNQVSPVVQVQALAPQLVPFAGGDVNFANLVNGLFFGLPVTLTSPIGPGVTQVSTFTPAGTLTPLQIAQVLETARQTAIANGIAAPTAQQIAVILNGGALPTAAGATTVSGLMTGTAATAATGTTGTQISPAAQLQSQRTFVVSDSLRQRGISDTPTPTNSTIGASSSGTATFAPRLNSSTAAGTAGTAAAGTSAPAAARIGTATPLGAR